MKEAHIKSAVGYAINTDMICFQDIKQMLILD